MTPVRRSADKLCLSFFTILLTVTRSFAQTPSPVAVSPEAAALAKMVNYTVSLNTGVPQISLPLYQAAGGGMTVPVDLSYHAGGFKVNERPTSVGLGWSLDCELQITRSINGLDDFKENVGYLANTQMRAYYPSGCPSCDFPLQPTADSWRNAYNLASGEWDGMPDKFNYRLLGKAGSFYFQKNDLGTGYIIVPVPHDNIKISYDNNLFTIVDSDGTTYHFGSTGNVGSGDRALRGLEESGNVVWEFPEERCRECKITSWKCKKIVNPTKTAEITFDYETKKTVYYPGSNNKLEVHTSLVECNPAGQVRAKDINSAITTYPQLVQQTPFYVLSCPKYFVSFRDYKEFHLPDVNTSGTISDRVFSGGENIGAPASGTSVRGLALKHITFPGGNINFDYDTDEALKKITIINSENQEVKSFSFFHSYSVSDLYQDLRTRYLDSVHAKNSNDLFERYVLAYNSRAVFGDRMTGQDAWAYSNRETKVEAQNAAANRNTVPAQKIKTRFFFSVGQGCRDYIDKTFLIGTGDTLGELPYEYAVTQRGMLHRIVYPTGGYVEFDYESNVYQENALARDGTGYYPMRRLAGGARIKSISYYDRAVASPNLPVRQKSYTYGEYENGVGLLINKPARRYNDGRLEYDGYHFEQTVGYLTGPSSVDCQSKECLGISGAETKTTYLPASGIDYTYSNGAPIYYTKVTEYEMDLGKFTGKKVYTYYPPETFGSSTDNFYNSNVIPDTDVPFLQTDGLIGLLKSVQDYAYEDRHYMLVHSTEYSYGKFAKSSAPRVVFSFFKTIYQVVGGRYSGSAFAMYDPTKSFFTAPFGPSIADYSNGQYGIEVAKVYMTQETEKWIENGSQVSKTTKYNYEFLPYLNPSSVEVEDSKGEKTKTYYTYPYNLLSNPVYDNMVAANILQPVIETRTVNTSRNLELSRTRTNYQLVTAGAQFYAPISIEKSYNGGPLELETSFTKYDQKANLLEVTSRDGLVKSYLWGYQYQYPIAEFTNATYATLASEVDVNALQTITDSQTLRGMLASLQQDAKPAIGRYFTYKPQVGMLSQTDHNGQQTSYEYDSYGRLLRIKDASGDIVKKYTYNGNILYKAQMSSIAVNTPQLGSFSKACDGGKYTSYNHIVPGGTRVSTHVQDANRLVLDDLFEPGGAGANAGSNVLCEPSTTSAITLKALMLNSSPIPDDVFIDFYGDNGIYGSQHFPYYQGSNNDVKFYFVPGNWRISLRATIEYRGPILKYWVKVSDGTSFYIKSGEMLQISPNLSYEITVSNAL